MRGQFINGTIHQVANFCVSPAFRHHLYTIRGRRSHFRYLFHIFHLKLFEKIHFEKVGGLMNCPICKGLMNCPLMNCPPAKPTGVHYLNWTRVHFRDNVFGWEEKEGRCWPLWASSSSLPTSQPISVGHLDATRIRRLDAAGKGGKEVAA